MRLIYLFIFGVSTAYAQDSLVTNELHELVITDEKLQSHNKSQHILILSDSLIDESSGTFTDLLLFNSPIYFKENGAGMVSSPSFRGTTAQQTAVLWNGIEINSSFLGQTDFNSLSYKEYDEIGIKAGGGSVLYGSGAIGGTIHLNNKIRFVPHFENQIQLSAGSFETYGVNYSVSAGDNRWFVQANYNHNQSENDYKVKNRNWNNTNASYENNSLSTTFAYRLNRYNEFHFLSNYYKDNRHFALVTPYQNRAKYSNETARNLVVWQYNNHHILSSFKAGYFYENFRYTENILTNTFSDGAVNTLLAKHDLAYQISEKLRLSTVLYFRNQQNDGENSSLANINQNTFSAALLGQYAWEENSGIEVGIKSEWANQYDSPLLFSAGWYQQFSDNYSTKIHLSRNFRSPTLNDIYWQPGGNQDLQSENSYQIDWGQTINIGAVTLQTNLYWTEISNMIRWLPTENGLWSVENTEEVSVKGIEISGQIPIKNNWFPITVHLGYNFNESVNKNTNKQLVYTPKHKLFGGWNINYRNFVFNVQGYFNGKVYTTTSNSENYRIEPYGILNATIGYNFNHTIRLFGTVRNLTDSHYENVENRPMPGRNYTVKLLINL